jgi:hypothetical protein
MQRPLMLMCIALFLGQAWPLAAAASGDARVAEQIAQAEEAVQRAAAQRALWTSAEESLVTAKKLFAAGSVNQASAPAQMAKELAELGLAQTTYPLFSE